MKILAVIALAVGVACFGPVAASAQTPELRLTAQCPPGTADQPQIFAQVTGLPPNAQFIGGYQVEDSSGIFGASTTFSASADGTFEITLTFLEPLIRFTGFVEFGGVRTEQTLERPCQLPTKKDECKNGGWQTYGVFKNQGDCVSFVATGGKNPPGGKTS
jgi:hypothetical protein